MNLTLSIPKDIEETMKELPKIKWTVVAREAIKEEAINQRKLVILDRYLRRKELTDKEYAFMDRIDWHPVDELELRDEYVKKLKRIEKQKAKELDINKLFKD